MADRPLHPARALPPLLRAALALAGGLACALAAEPTFQLLVRAGIHDHPPGPLRVLLPLGDAQATRAEVVLPDGTRLAGQLTAPDLLAPGGGAGQRELHVLLPRLVADSSLQLTVRVPGAGTGAADGVGFAWQAGPAAGEDELRHDGHPVLRYEHLAYDARKPGENYKVFHHLFAPGGELLLTKGAGGQFPHHRGIFYGFMKVGWGERKVDIWHCRDGAHQAHGAIELAEAGPVVARQRLLIHWNAKEGETFAEEQRELTVYRFGEGTLVEFFSRLRSTVGELTLDGDPQHAGFHVRAANEVAGATKAQTSFIRPDGAGRPGETRNWPQKEATNLPWDAMHFVTGGKDFTVAYLDHPANPKEARYSEREYGRFGSCFKHTLDDGHPLEVRYRLWVQGGTMAVADIAAQGFDFTAPPSVEILSSSP
jgi:hypothetical protein